MDDDQNYMRWLEGMWEVQRFDPQVSAEQEERRTEEVLEVFVGLRELSKRRVALPQPPPWEASQW